MTEPLIAASGVTRVLPGVVPVTLVHDIDLVIGRKSSSPSPGHRAPASPPCFTSWDFSTGPPTGTVLVDGVDTGGLAGPALDRLRLERLGFAFQFHFLLPEFTALDNVLIPIRRLGQADRPGLGASARRLC